MIHFADITYYCHTEYTRPEQVLQHHNNSLGYLNFIDSSLKVHVIKHANHEGEYIFNGISYAFFKGRNKFFHIPFKTNFFARKIKPDITLIQGLGFPIQTIILRASVGRNCRILVQHHGEQPGNGIKKFFQQMAERCIDGFVFTTTDHAAEWMTAKIIRTPTKCYEVLEGSTAMQRKNKVESRQILNMSEHKIFLWVGRLIAIKDPITVLRGFEQFAKEEPGCRLYMIYQDDTLLQAVQQIIEHSTVLKGSVILVGKVDNETMNEWYSAADFFISGSRREGSGFALIESMACGCVPIVTNIPSFRKITNNGEMGGVYIPGDVDDLAQKLKEILAIDLEKASKNIVQYFEANLSYKAIAAQFFDVCKQVLATNVIQTGDL